MGDRKRLLRPLVIAGVVAFSVLSNGHFGVFDIVVIVVFVVVAVALLAGVTPVSRMFRGASDEESDGDSTTTAAPQPGTVTAVPTPPAAEATGDAEQLERLEQLHRDGLLNDRARRRQDEAHGTHRQPVSYAMRIPRPRAEPLAQGPPA